jgi:hypothetical protein
MKVNGLGDYIARAVIVYPEEMAGFLFAKNLYSPQEEWLIIPVKNVSPEPENSWMPDKAGMLKAKKAATDQGYIKIGNIHSHPCPDDARTVEEWGQLVKPSDKDLWFARRFNDIVRIIILVDKFSVLSTFVHDKFGNQIKVMLVEE